MLIRSKPFHKVPKIIYPIIAGYHGTDGGIGISWLGWLLKIINPINIRKPICWTPIFWLYFTHNHLCFWVLGSTPHKALFSIDLAHLSYIYPVHSIFWLSFTKRTSGTRTDSQQGKSSQ